jgi:pullulanase/glycogen debranching enzyme
MIAFRKRHSALNRREFLNPEDVAWHGQLPLLPDFSQFSGHIALQLFGSHTGREPDQDLYIAFSMEKKETWWELPHPSKGKSWGRFLDTTLEAPNELEPSESREICLPGQTYRLGPEGILVMVAKPA